MIKIFIPLWVAVFVLGIGIFVTGCARNGPIKHMQEVSKANLVLKPQAGKSLIVFMRPAEIDLYMYQTDVFYLNEGAPEIVGILAAGTAMTYQLHPGKHTFMSAGFGATTEFLNADMAPNRTYYVVMDSSGSLGTWHNYFKPLTKAETSIDEIHETMDELRLIEKNPESEAWVKSNMPDISRRGSRLEKAQNKKVIPNLIPDDGW